MSTTRDISEYFAKISEGLITSASGWRKIFKKSLDSYTRLDGCVQHEVSMHDYTVVYYATLSYLEIMAKYLEKKGKINKNYKIAVARDTRPTGADLVRAVIHACEDYQDVYGSHFKVVQLGIICIPQIMAYTEQYTNGFVYVTASHNPVEYNGLKFGGGHGQVISKVISDEVIENFYSKKIMSSVVKRANELRYADDDVRKSFVAYEDKIFKSVFRGYKKTSLFVSQTGVNKSFFTVIQDKIRLLPQKPGVIFDPNGGARSNNFDANFLNKFRIPVQCINNSRGVFSHDILPEGNSLIQARQLLSKLIKIRLNKNEDYCIATVCDCDGDRGTMVLLSEGLGAGAHGFEAETRVLEAQEVFALALYIELAWERIINPSAKIAVVVNGPTSLRCNIIANYFECKLVRVEVGEANVVDTAYKLIQKGFSVPIVGEGSNGGCVILPSSVRDPMCSTLSFLKLMIWGNSLYKGTHIGGIASLHELLSILPSASTTQTGDTNAIVNIPPNITYKEYIKKVFNNFADAYHEFQKIFIDNAQRVAFIKVSNFVGDEEIDVDLKNIEIEKGGCAVQFFGENNNSKNGNPLGFVWIRPSGTEPVVRIMADAVGKNARQTQKKLLQLWQKVLGRSKV